MRIPFPTGWLTRRRRRVLDSHLIGSPSVGALAGSTTISLTSTAAIGSEGTLSGSTTVSLSSSAALIGTGVLAGSTMASLSATASLITVDLRVGERTVIWNGREAAPSGDPGGFGNWTAFPGLLGTRNLQGPLHATVNDYVTSGALAAYYLRSTGHLTETGSHRISMTADGGRTWDQVGDELTNRFSTTVSLRGPRPYRFQSGRIGVIYSARDLDLSDPTDSARSSYSDDEGATWSTAVSIAANVGSHETFAGSSLVELDDGTILATVYAQNTGQTRYIAYCYEAADEDMTSWSQRSVIWDPGNGSSLQPETPNLGMLSDGRLLCLIRVDTDGYVYRMWSSDEGLTWTTPTQVFQTRRLPFFVELADIGEGTIVAVASPSTGYGTRTQQLYLSRDFGSSWLGPVDCYSAYSDTKDSDDQMEAMLVEVAPGLVGVLYGQEVTTNQTSRLIYQEVGVGITPPSRSPRSSRSALWPNPNDSYVDYGNAEYGEVGAHLTVEAWYRKDGSTLGTETILSRAGTNQLQFRLFVNSTGHFVMGIATSLTATATYTSTDAVIQDRAYHIVAMFDGTQTGNSNRLRMWIYGLEDTTGTYFSTIPASMTAPNTTATTRLGGYGGASSQNLRETHLAFVRLWTHSIAAGDVATLYNGGVPLSLSAANTAVGASAVFSFPLDNSWDDEVGFFAAGSYTVTGTPAFSERWVP